MVSAPPIRAGHRLAFAGAVGLVVGLDQVTKHLALNGLDDGPVHLVGPLRLALTYNDGAAFNMGSGNTFWITLVALGVSSVIAYLGLRADRRTVALGYGFLLGGAAGNLVDRVLRDGDGFLAGHVVDFIDPRWWPVFNVADVSLWVGIGLLLLASLRQDPEVAP